MKLNLQDHSTDPTLHEVLTETRAYSKMLVNGCIQVEVFGYNTKAEDRPKLRGEQSKLWISLSGPEGNALTTTHKKGTQ